MLEWPYQQTSVQEHVDGLEVTVLLILFPGKFPTPWGSKVLSSQNRWIASGSWIGGALATCCMGLLTRCLPMTTYILE